ncbi:MAG: hypothetical protein LBO74_01000 [Candidatus Symbiothrix sp.]|jgi:predicted enzyme related to lactoylglutathione lyase|nr:hypothetical protein [Candidatus Symbiothrix sp.]
MKKITLILAAFALLFSAQTMSAQFSGGNGTEANPYLISTKADLEAIGNSAFLEAGTAGLYFEQTADIDLGGEATPWEPISHFSDSSFKGTYNGNGKKITNIYINTTGASDGQQEYFGLFGVVGVGAVIQDVHIVGGSITVTENGGSVYAAGVVGRVNGNDVWILNCSNSANVTSTANSGAAGGIVGRIDGDGGIVFSSYNTGNVSSGQYTGGIVGRGYAGSATIQDCYSVGNISSTGSDSPYAGGIAGYVYTSGTSTAPSFYTVEKCYAAGTVACPAGTAAGIVGRATNDAQVIVLHNVALQTSLDGKGKGIIGGNVNTGTTDNYSISTILIDGAAKSATTAAHGLDVTPEDAKTKLFYETILDWDFTDDWTIVEGVSYPTLQANPVISAGTGINRVNVENGAIVAQKYYNLQGIEVSASATGVIIVKNIHASGAVSSTKELKLAK